MNDEQIYRKYPHIVPGSIECIPNGRVIKCGKDNIIISHGKVCVIKCQTDGSIPGCHKTRIINIQDARQVKFCKYCTKYLRNLRKRISRNS